MANHKNAKKTIRQIAKRTLINKRRNSDVKTIIKKVLAAVEAKDLAGAETLFIQAQKKIDMRLMIQKKTLLAIQTQNQKASRSHLLKATISVIVRHIHKKKEMGNQLLRQKV